MIQFSLAQAYQCLGIATHKCNSTDKKGTIGITLAFLLEGAVDFRPRTASGADGRATGVRNLLAGSAGFFAETPRPRMFGDGLKHSNIQKYTTRHHQ